MSQIKTKLKKINKYNPENKTKNTHTQKNMLLKKGNITLLQQIHK